MFWVRVDNRLIHGQVVEAWVPFMGARHIIVGNDNNLPFSSGRALGKSDDNELILLKVTDLLKAK